ncbi:MAG: exo-alpha-sialidase [Bacteroidales bacterium]|nr:exo-alpha-sialidase [Bacteroidales bacterium]
MSLILPSALTAQNQQSLKPSMVNYQWRNVQIVGGGFVSGIIFHPAAANVCYCRTDMGGAYRRNEQTMRWEPLLDWLSYEDVNLMGVESIALDPSDPDRVYLACGTYTSDKTPDGAILYSNDQGKTFQRTDVHFKMGGNEDGRGNGERMAVDPNDGSTLYLGTRHAGLWISTDYAKTWTLVESFPEISENPPENLTDPDSIRLWKRLNQGSGIIFVIFDPASGSAGKASSVIYAGVSVKNRENLYRSSDAGKTWYAVEGQPVQYRPTQAVLASDGTMYITYGDAPGPSRMTNGGVWKLQTRTGEWTEITPDKPDPKTRPFGYAAVSADAKNPDVLIVSSYHRYHIDNGEDIFYSADGGSSWKKIFGSGGTLDPSLAPYTANTGIHWLLDIEIDPCNSDHAIFTTGYGGHETFNLTDADRDKPTNWIVMTTGIEETVALDLLSPPKGAHLISAVGDYGGFVHWDPDKPAPEGNFSNPRFGNTNGLACAENSPGIIVRVGRATNQNPGKNIGYSTDGGRTWHPADTIPHPEARLGHIAVSSDGSAWVWAPDPIRSRYDLLRNPQLLPVFHTFDKGASWTECKGIPHNTRVIADRVNPKKLYGMNLPEGKLFISADRGISFSEHPLILPDSLPRHDGYRGDSRGGQDRIYATPGREGDLWIAAFDGLYHSTDEGMAFTKSDDVSEIHAFGFGKGAPGNNNPVIYLVGVVKGIRGIFCSEDIAQTWMRINDNQHQWGLVLHITGDPKKYERVYVGTHGRGIIYGDRMEQNSHK